GGRGPQVSAYTSSDELAEFLRARDCQVDAIAVPQALHSAVESFSIGAIAPVLACEQLFDVEKHHVVASRGLAEIGVEPPIITRHLARAHTWQADPVDGSATLVEHGKEPVDASKILSAPWLREPLEPSARHAHILAVVASHGNHDDLRLTPVEHFPDDRHPVVHVVAHQASGRFGPFDHGDIFAIAQSPSEAIGKLCCKGITEHVKPVGFLPLQWLDVGFFRELPSAHYRTRLHEEP